MRRWLAIAVLAGLTLGACGSSSTKTVTATTTVPVVASSTGSPTTSTTTSSTSTSTGVSTSSTSSTSGPVLHLATFRSPSGNIGCMIIGGFARCDIRQRSWSPPPRPKSCPNVVDFGQGLEVGASGSGRLVCAGDTVMDPVARTLPYGASTAVGQFRCMSTTSQMGCLDSTTGHGFSLSAQGYRAF